jgi:hypothetical protein
MSSITALQILWIVFVITSHQAQPLLDRAFTLMQDGRSGRHDRGRLRDVRLGR